MKSRKCHFHKSTHWLRHDVVLYTVYVSDICFLTVKAVGFVPGMIIIININETCRINIWSICHYVKAHYSIKKCSVHICSSVKTTDSTLPSYCSKGEEKKLDVEHLAHSLKVHFCFHISFCSTYPRDSSNRLWIVPLGQDLEASERDVPVTGGH